MNKFRCSVKFCAWALSAGDPRGSPSSQVAPSDDFNRMTAWCISQGGDPSMRMPFPALRSRHHRARTMGPGGRNSHDRIARSCEKAVQSVLQNERADRALLLSTPRVQNAMRLFVERCSHLTSANRGGDAATPSRSSSINGRGSKLILLSPTGCPSPCNAVLAVISTHFKLMRGVFVIMYGFGSPLAF